MFLSGNCVYLNNPSNWIRMRNGTRANRQTLWIIHNVIPRIIEINIDVDPYKDQLEVNVHQMIAFWLSVSLCVLFIHNIHIKFHDIVDRPNLIAILLRLYASLLVFSSTKSTSIYHVSRYGISIPQLCKLFGTIWVNSVRWSGPLYASFVSSSSAAGSTTTPTIYKRSHASSTTVGHDAVARQPNMVSATDRRYASARSQVSI